MEYLVDVIMPVYNHEKFLAQAIESIMAQQTTFNYRLIIGEDCSKDRSREIAKEYAAKYPDKVFPQLHEKNLGASQNGAFLLNFASSKYIAICEGDDYWTDPTKLQQQVDFMEANPDFAFCFTTLDVIDDTGKKHPDFFPKITKDVYGMEDVVNAAQLYVSMATILFRNVMPRPLPAFYVKYIIADNSILLLLSDKGKSKYLDINTAVYRLHGAGISKTNFFRENQYQMFYSFFEEVNQYFNYKYDKLFRKRLHDTTKTLLTYCAQDLKGMAKMRHGMRNFPKYLKYAGEGSFKDMLYYAGVSFFPSLLKIKAKKEDA